MTKAHRIISSLHFQHFPQYRCSSQQGSFFLITPTLNCIPNFSVHLLNPLVTLSRAPITTGMTSTILSFHNLPISLFKSWYFSTFPFLFPLLLHQLLQQCRWLSPFAQLQLCLVFLPLSHCHTEHWYPTKLWLLHFLITTPSGTCSYHFSVCSNPFFVQKSQWTFFATLLCRLLYSFWAHFSHPHIIIIIIIIIIIRQ